MAVTSLFVLILFYASKVSMGVSTRLGTEALPRWGCSRPGQGAGAAGTGAGSRPRQRLLVVVLGSCLLLSGGRCPGWSPSEWLPLAGAGPSPVGGQLGCDRHQLMPRGSPSSARSHRRAGGA